MWALRMGFEGSLSPTALPFVSVDALRQDCSYHSFVISLVLCSVNFFFLFEGKKEEKNEKDIVD